MIYSFIGDSEIARWDLQQYFPVLKTENLGIGGVGLEYIKSNESCMRGKIAVVEFGTNDINRTTRNYVEEYVDAIGNLQAEVTIVISIMPRHWCGDGDGINQKIRAINDSIRTEVLKKGWVYVDVFPLMMQDEDINWDYYTDGLHLSAHGYELIAGELKKVFE